MGSIWKENWKRTANRLLGSQDLDDNKDLVRLQDQSTLTTNASGITGFPIVGVPSSGNFIQFNGLNYIFANITSIEVETGTYSGDGASPRTITTGLTKPIRFLFIAADFGTGDGRDITWGFRTDTMPGRDVAVAEGGVTNMGMTAGAGFIGSDFDVRADDIAFNDASATGHWIAIGFD